VKPETGSIVTSEIERDILSYLAKHPDAGDTLEGIVQWWLLEQLIERQIAETKHELQELVTKGLVHKFHAGGGRIHYRVNFNKQAEIGRILSQYAKAAI